MFPDLMPNEDLTFSPSRSEKKLSTTRGTVEMKAWSEHSQEILNSFDMSDFPSHSQVCLTSELAGSTDRALSW